MQPRAHLKKSPVVVPSMGKKKGPACLKAEPNFEHGLTQELKRRGEPKAGV